MHTIVNSVYIWNVELVTANLRFYLEVIVACIML